MTNQELIDKVMRIIDDHVSYYQIYSDSFPHIDWDDIESLKVSITAEIQKHGGTNE